MIESARYLGNGFIAAVIDGQETVIPDDLGNRHRRMLTQWGGTIEPHVPPPPPDPAAVPPSLVASALRVVVAGGDVSEIGGVFQLVAALYLDVGQFMLLFIEPQPDDQYFEVISGGSPCMTVSERASDYLIVESRESIGGALVDPPPFSIQIFRS